MQKLSKKRLTVGGGLCYNRRWRKYCYIRLSGFYHS